MLGGGVLLLESAHDKESRLGLTGLLGQESGLTLPVLVDFLRETLLDLLLFLETPEDERGGLTAFMFFMLAGGTLTDRLLFFMGANDRSPARVM